MKINPFLMELVRGEWLMSFQGVQTYFPIVNQMLLGESVNFDFDKSTKALTSFYNSSGIKQSPKEITEGTIAVIDMVGPVMKYGDMCTYGADEIVNALREANNNPNIIGSVLNIDGPGGAVSAIGPFLQFAKEKTKTVVSLVDQCTSLHYWAACAVSDFIMADNNVSANIGSVGVVSTLSDNRKMLEERGIKFHEIYPLESTHKNEAYRLALEGKYDLMKSEFLSPLAQKFQNGVRTTRPNLKEELGVLTGKNFSADKALEYGMIDGIGSLEKAFNIIKVKSEINTNINN